MSEKKSYLDPVLKGGPGSGHHGHGGLEGVHGGSTPSGGGGDGGGGGGGGGGGSRSKPTRQEFESALEDWNLGKAFLDFMSGDTAEEIEQSAKSADDKARTLGEKFGTKIPNDKVGEKVKSGDYLLHIDGGGYGATFGKVESIKKKIQPMEDRRSDGEYSWDILHDKGAYSSYPEANWYSSDDEFYKVDLAESEEKEHSMKSKANISINKQGMSMQDEMRAIREAFEDEYRGQSDTPIESSSSDYPWIVDTYSTYVIVDDDGDLFRVDYSITKGDGEDVYDFAPRSEWVPVEKRYIETDNSEKEQKHHGKVRVVKGGPGSGHHGHSGLEGVHGGSTPSGGGGGGGGRGGEGAPETKFSGGHRKAANSIMSDLNEDMDDGFKRTSVHRGHGKFKTRIRAPESGRFDSGDEVDDVVSKVTSYLSDKMESYDDPLKSSKVKSFRDDKFRVYVIGDKSNKQVRVEVVEMEKSKRKFRPIQD